MATRYFGLAAVTIPEEDERFDTEEECQARCDELTAAIAAQKDRKCRDQKRNGYLHRNGITSWDDTKFIPSRSVGRTYWHPLLVKA